MAKARKAFIRKRPKRTNKPPSRKEQAQMLALSELGMGTYEIGEVMGRAPTTIRKYLASPMFQDEKFAALIEDYKAKELIDLTALNIESRARLHDLVPTMTPIEAIALMDKSFGQRRLLEGKSTENIFSLRRIISEAHEPSTSSHVREEKQDAPKQIEAPKEETKEAAHQP